MVGNIVGRGRIGTDERPRKDWHAPVWITALSEALVDRFGLGVVTVRAVFPVQRASLARLLEIDLAQPYLRPAWRAQLHHGGFNSMQVSHTHAGRITLGLGNRPAILLQQLQPRTNPQCLSNVARHRLHGRTVPLNPVEVPDIPELWIANRGVGDAVVDRVNGVTEGRVGDASEGRSSRAHGASRCRPC